MSLPSCSLDVIPRTLLKLLKYTLIAELAYHQMDVCGSHWMPINGIQELIRRTIGRKRVCSRSQAVETVLSVLIGLVLPSKVVVALVIGILEVVFAVATCLPHIKCYIRDRLLRCEIPDRSVHVGDHAFVLVLNDAVAQFPPWCVG